MLRAQTLKSIRQYKSDTSGQVAVIFAMLALPILALTTFALDYSEFTRVEDTVASALDDAALAAVLDQTITDEERADVARQYFWENFEDNGNFNLTVLESTKERVELKVQGYVDLSVSDAFGMKKFEVEKMAASETTQEDVICVLALDPDGANAFEVTRGSNFHAIDCSVQVNSTNVRAALVDGTSSVRAKSFCVGGGVRGTYTPSVNTECRSIEDPYKSVQAPPSDPCVKPGGTRLQGQGQNGVAGGTTLQPGTYCGGLAINGLDVDFAPGTYIIQDGPLTFMRGSEAYGQNVTFVMRGDISRLTINNGSKLTLKAPNDGPLAGLVFFQDTHYTGDVGRKSLEAQNVLRGGSDMSITGTVYFPTQEIIVAGGSGLSAKAPATSFIGKRVMFTQDAGIIVRADHQRADIPPLLPRADEGARLVR